MAPFDPGFRLVDGSQLNQSLGATSAPPCGFQWFVGGPQANVNSIVRATALARPGDVIWLAPGAHAESVTMPVPGVTLAGAGPYGSCAIVPPGADPALTIDARNCYVTNVGLAAGTGATAGLVIHGDAYTIENCKIETQDSVGVAVFLDPQAVSGMSASQGKLVGNEICWCATGVSISQGVIGFTTQCLVRGGRFHNCSVASISEDVVGSARNLMVDWNLFERMEDGSEPTNYIILGAGNTGVIANNSFATANNGGKNSVPVTLIWSSNFMSDGVSAAQPS